MCVCVVCVCVCVVVLCCVVCVSVCVCVCVCVCTFGKNIGLHVCFSSLEKFQAKTTYFSILTIYICMIETKL